MEGHPRGDPYYDTAMFDHIALTISYDAMKWLEVKKPDFWKLPTTRTMSVYEVFFVAGAFTRCFTSNNFVWGHYREIPPRFHRVNRALSSFKPFGDVFGCKYGDPMVATPRCKLLEQS